MQSSQAQIFSCQPLPCWGESATRPVVVAHRGGADLWPENSLCAFNNALSSGFRTFEIDVQGTRDGELVVIHDLTIDRTSDGCGAVRELSFAELQGARLSGTRAERIPRLADVLALFRENRATAIVEVKFKSEAPEHDDLCKRLATALEVADLLASTTVSAFDWSSLTVLREISPQINLTAVASAQSLLRLGGIESAIASAVNHGAGDLALEWTAVDPRTAAATRANGLRLGVWTVNEPSQLRELAVRGVDWIITDRPDLGAALSLDGASPL